MATSPAARLSRVTKRFGDFVAVSELSFEVEAGLVYGVLGPNGAGKSTTLRMLNDIIAPDDGEIELLGRFVPGTEAGRHIGYLPEERGLYPKLRVAETLEFFAQLRGIGVKDSRKRAMAWLERLGLGEWAQKRVQDLSKGMQQKVQFAAALIHEPELLILDEPWSGLDPLNADVLRNIVLEHRDAGHTVLFSTHLMDQAEKICDRVCIIAGGKKAAEGKIADLRREAAPVGRVHLSFEDDAARARAVDTVLADDALVASVRESDGDLELQLKAEVEPGTLLAELVRAQLPIKRFERKEPSLHEIFVERVGTASAPRSPSGGDS